MKRGVVLIFLLLTTMVFAEDNQIDEVLGLKNEIKKLKVENAELKELEKRFIRLEATMSGIEKERMSSVDYYEKALEDSKEYYKSSYDDAKVLYEEAKGDIDRVLDFVYVVVGLMLAILGYVKWNQPRQLKKEKQEILDYAEEQTKELKDLENKLGKQEIEFEEKIRNLNLELDAKIDLNTWNSKDYNNNLAFRNEKLEELHEKIKGKNLKELEIKILHTMSFPPIDVDYTLECLEKMKELDKKNLAYYTNAGAIWSEVKKDDDKAIKIYLEGIVNTGENALLLSNLGNSYWRKEEFKKALEAYKNSYRLKKEVDVLKMIYLCKRIEEEELIITQKEYCDLRKKLEVSKDNSKLLEDLNSEKGITIV